MDMNPSGQIEAGEAEGLFQCMILAGEPSRRGARVDNAVRRRPSPSQGRGLEALGHAIEYLVDSRMRRGVAATAADLEAEQRLMDLSRAVFAECREVVPPARAGGDWIVPALVQLWLIGAAWLLWVARG